MDNNYLQQLIDETTTRGGGLILNHADKPAVVVLSIERYNQLLKQISSAAEPSLAGQFLFPQNSRDQLPKSNSRVLVTGGAGYIGGHLVDELIKAGFEVAVLDNLSTGKKTNINPKAVFIEGDLADKNLLKDIFASGSYEAVFHMAASLEVEESVREPEKYFHNNSVNTINLLDAMEEAGVKKIIFSSTAAVYGQTEDGYLTESSQLHPNNPYGSSKLLAERIIKYYCQYSGFKAVVFRYFNACGFAAGSHILPTHQSHLIYKVLQVAKGNSAFLEIYGNDYQTFDGTCVRDYVHVLDIVLPHILALEKMDNLSEFQVYNIGTGKGSSVTEVVNSAAEILNKIIPMQMGPKRPGDAPITVADNSKLLNELGYELKFSDLQNMIASSWEVIKNL